MMRIVVMCHAVRPCVTTKGVGVHYLGEVKQHATVIFRIKWVWIWLRLSGTRVPSRGAFFGRKDYPRSQKKKNSAQRAVL